MKNKAIVLLAAFALLVSAPALAGDALLVCQPGVPFVWGNGGVGIPFNPDQGDLSTVFGIDNATGTAIIQSSFDAWGNLPQAGATYVNTGQLPVDVDITNFTPWLNGIIGDGLSPIVYDATGEIFDLLFGPGSGILGFAGPEAGITALCEITEGQSFLNGAAFDDLQAAADVTVHEFGHYSNLGHVELNGQLLVFAEGSDDTGPSPDNTTFPPPASFLGLVETMYPLYFGPGAGTDSPHSDDISAFAQLYPAPGYASTVGTITGTVFGPNGEPLSGVNVIARNVADPFVDSVSTFSGAFTDGTDPGTDPNVGVFTLTNLTPGATYKLFVDTVTAQAGRFSNPIVQPLPAPEEYWNGALESADAQLDDPADSTDIVLAAGEVFTADIFLNAPAPGQLTLGDDDTVNLPLPFTYRVCGESFDSVFVNSNGNLTFGAGSTDFSESTAEFLAGPPRIAPLWDDLSPNQGGVVRFEQTSTTFTVFFEGVPEFLAGNDNTFSITLKKWSQFAFIDYDNIDATDGIAGLSCGGFVTTSLEEEEDLRKNNQSFVFKAVVNKAARFENFTDADNDLDDLYLTFSSLGVVFNDYLEPNDSLSQARWIGVPFSSEPFWFHTEIDPIGDDVDFYRFHLNADETLLADIRTGSSLDTILGLFDPATGDLLAFDDDGGTGVLSRIIYTAPTSGTYALAVSTFGDTDFTGAGGSGGRYVLDVDVLEGTLITLGDDSSLEVALDFAFPFQGATYNSVFVNSNGNLTFGSGDTDFSESVAELLADQPRIAPLWDDLSPNQGGLVLVDGDSSSFTLRFQGVPEFFATTGNSFDVTLFADGRIVIEYGTVAAQDGIVGVTPGGGAADPGETDFSAGGSFSANGTTYEQFTFGDAFDLSGTTIEFLP